MAASIPIFLYENRLAKSTVTISVTGGSPTPSASDVMKALDNKSWTTFVTNTVSPSNYTEVVFDLGSAKVCDTVAVMHGLTTGTSISVSYSDDNITYLGGVSVAADGYRSKLYYLAGIQDWSVAHRYFKLTCTEPNYRMLWLGKGLACPEGMDGGWDIDDKKLEYRDARSRDGSFIGGIVSYVGQTMTLNFGEGGLPESFFNDDVISQSNQQPQDGTWQHFTRSCWQRGRPFFFQWERPYTAAVTLDAWFGWPPKDGKSKAPFAKVGTRRDWKFNFNVLCEDTVDD